MDRDFSNTGTRNGDDLAHHRMLRPTPGYEVKMNHPMIKINSYHDVQSNDQHDF
jgi:hypothetical protein